MSKAKSLKLILDAIKDPKALEEISRSTKLYEFMDDPLTKKELTDTIKMIIELTKKIQKSSDENSEELIAQLNEISKKLKSDMTQYNGQLEERLTKKVTEYPNQIRTLIDKVDTKLSQVRDGSDGTKGEKGDRGDKGEIGLQGSPAKVVEFKKTLEKELKDLKEEISKLKNRGFGGVGASGGGGGGGGGRVVKSYDLSSSLNGVLKTFSLPVFWRVISVHNSSFPNVLRPTTDYTTDNSAFTITFTSEIGASTALAAGQTVIIIYSE